MRQMKWLEKPSVYRKDIQNMYPEHDSVERFTDGDIFEDEEGQITGHKSAAHIS